MQKKVISLLVCLATVLTILCACQSRTQQKNENSTSDISNEDVQDVFKEKEQTTAASSTSGTQNKDEQIYSDWKTAYLDFIERRENAYDYNHEYALVYVDNNDTPELYVQGIAEAEGDLVLSYKNGKIIEQHLARLFGGKYIERSGKIINQNGHMGGYYDNVYKLDENGFSQILRASYTERYVGDANDPEVITEYSIDGNNVTQADYTAAINAAFDISAAVRFSDSAVSYEVITQQIADCT